MNAITIEGQAKINFTLDILGLRVDGYHEVATVMQSISLSDTISLQPLDDNVVKLTLEGNIAGLETDENNLAYRAARLILDESKIKAGVAIKLIKRIPIAAGLAGGSTDAAGVLKGVNELYKLGFSQEALCELGARLGSDIPFCLLGGTMFSTGRGEILDRLPNYPKTYLVLAKPKVAVSTAWAFKSYDEYQGDIEHPDNDSMIKAIKKGDRLLSIKYFSNVLEPVTVRKYPIIEEYKKLFLGNNIKPLNVMMSGSGPTVFALMNTKEDAENIAEYMRNNIDGDVFIAHTT